MANTNNLASDVVDRVTGHAQELADQIAESIGGPIDANPLTRAQITQLWNMPNPQANPLQIQQLLAQGQHAQALDLAFPWRNRLIGKGQPQDRVDRAARFAQWAMEGST